MPELPDLQVFTRNLTKLFVGKKVKTVNVRNQKKLNVTEKKLKEAIEGRKLREICREGKELHFKFDKDTNLALHLMLRGQLHFFENAHDKKYPRSSKSAFPTAPDLL
jgi:formamidopyrimidine-DNA glycosylase